MNILVSSAGRRVRLVRLFQESLLDLGLAGSVIAADASPTSPTRAIADEFVLVPRCDQDHFLSGMLEVCLDRRVDLIVPTIDTELGSYASSRDLFASSAAGTTVLISDPLAIAISADKRQTSAWLNENDLPGVPTTGISDVLRERATWQLPLFVKPAMGSSSIGASIVNNWESLEARTSEQDVIVQPVLTGIEVTADAWVNRRGRCECVVLRQRLEVRGGEVTKAVTIRRPDVASVVKTVVEALPGSFGAITVQLFVADDTVQVVEINPRFAGGFPLTYQAGAPFPRWAIEESLGLPSSASDESWRAGVVMLRYDEAVFFEAGAVGL